MKKAEITKQHTAFKLQQKAWQGLTVFFGWLFSIVILLSPPIAHANPEGETVVSGNASVERDGSLTTIHQRSERAVIDWHTFNIGTGEHTHFEQPSSTAVTLNRVTGGQGASQIFGQLTATGQVWILNPQGVYFGPDAYVNVAGVLASTYDMSNQDFMSGHYQFVPFAGEHHGRVLNEGTVIASGLAALLSHDVENIGLIRAHLGQIILGSNPEWTLDFYGDDLIHITVDQSLLQTPARIVNSGELIADGGYVFLSIDQAEGVLENVINHTGLIGANTVALEAGIIVLSAGNDSVVTVSGSVLAQGDDAGELGGDIQMTGQFVSLTSPAVLKASGDSGGGKVLVGGDVQGLGALQTAQSTFVAEGAHINASGVTSGDGGTVVVWADDATFFYGMIKAMGGSLSGDGGFVETSGKVSLFVNSVPNVSSPNGMGGTWLLDPSNINIVAGSGSTDITSTMPFTPTGDDAFLGVELVLAALGSGNVVIKTTSANSEAGNINLLTSFDVTNANNANGYSLTLEADNNIAFGANVDITNTSSGDIILRADADGIGIVGGTVTFDATASLTSSAGGDVFVYYNPDSFGTPTNFTEIAVSGGGDLVAYQLVHTIAHLGDLDADASNLTENFALAGDLDNANIAFASIGGTFTGQFDGQDFSVSNLNITSTTSTGLFEVVSGTIKNLNLIGGTVTSTGSSADIGSLAGRLSGGIVDNVESSVVVSGISTSSLFGIGGLVGSALSGSTISNSSATGNVTGTNSNSKNIGGLVGRHSASTLKNSHATGNVIGGHEVGGLVGYNFADATITNAFASGKVSGGVAGSPDFYDFGGLVGWNNDASIIDSYATGEVTGFNLHNVGGLVGDLYGESTIENSYATGNVFGESQIGGLVGVVEAGSGSTISDSYATGDVLGINQYVGGLIGRASSKVTLEQAHSTGKVTLDTDATGYGLPDSTFYGNVGGLAGSFQNNSVVTDSHATGVVMAVGSDLDCCVGGFAGGIYDTTVKNSYSTGDVHADTSNSTTQSVDVVGGFSGETSNATIEDSYSTGKVVITSNDGITEIGGFSGLDNGSTFLRAHSTGNVSTAGDQDSNIKGIGGFFGDVFGVTTVEESYATGNITVNATSATSIQNVGGFVGYVDDGNFVDSYATGNITITSTPSVNHENVGGFVGYFWRTTLNTVFATGNVTASNHRNVGGLVGYNDFEVLEIKNAYATGNVSGGTYVGGLIGYIDNDNATPSTITNVYAAGSVTGTITGGLIGKNGEDTLNIFNSYWDSTSTGQVNAVGENSGIINSLSEMQAKSTIHMKKKVTFCPDGSCDGTGNDWNFDSVWHMDEGSTYPKLFYQTLPSVASASSSKPTTTLGNGKIERIQNESGEPFGALFIRKIKLEQVNAIRSQALDSVLFMEIRDVLRSYPHASPEEILIIFDEQAHHGYTWARPL